MTGRKLDLMADRMERVENSNIAVPSNSRRCKVTFCLIRIRDQFRHLILRADRTLFHSDGSVINWFRARLSSAR